MKSETINKPAANILNQASQYFGATNQFKLKPVKNGQVYFGFSFWNTYCPMFVVSCNLNSPRYASINFVGHSSYSNSDIKMTATLNDDDSITIAGFDQSNNVKYIYSDMNVLSKDEIIMLSVT